MRRGPVSVAAFWRVLRTLGGKNIGKCRLRAHQHPLLPPLSNLRPRKLPPARLIYKRVLGDGLLLASILDFRPRLANRCRVFPVYTLFRASILDFKPKLANRCKVFSGNILVSAEFVVSTVFRVRFQSLLRREEWPACNDRRDNDLPCPILIFAAAKKNGPPAAPSWGAGGDWMPRRRHNPK